jgi:hypothetical protein
VAIRREFKTLATARADMPASSVNAGRNYSAPSRAASRFALPLALRRPNFDALGFLRCQGVFSAPANQRPLFLGEGGINVQHERVCISAQLCDDKGRLVAHKAANEMHVSEPIEQGVCPVTLTPSHL